MDSAPIHEAASFASLAEIRSCVCVTCDAIVIQRLTLWWDISLRSSHGVKDFVIIVVLIVIVAVIVSIKIITLISIIFILVFPEEFLQSQLRRPAYINEAARVYQWNGRPSEAWQERWIPISHIPISISIARQYSCLVHTLTAKVESAESGLPVSAPCRWRPCFSWNNLYAFVIQNYLLKPGRYYFPDYNVDWGILNISIPTCPPQIPVLSINRWMIFPHRFPLHIDFFKYTLVGVCWRIRIVRFRLLDGPGKDLPADQDRTMEDEIGCWLSMNTRLPVFLW